MDHAEGDALPFAWYLNLWLNVFRRDEAEFWRRANPRRCVALYREYVQRSDPLPRKAPESEGESLGEYLRSAGVM